MQPAQVLVAIYCLLSLSPEQQPPERREEEDGEYGRAGVWWGHIGP